ncbi:hypothetical protein EGR_06255 [Echinococcus granulosus]|uniref:Transmembrane protein n=1 Tax=Echinococcus granulosus TaxID=6210 RepID=W6UDE7_ECHGR|nr:hypothetical protein EGR_06255 [Echinococcus granulosus]EUB58831.1 hypothetical protein EGR_06255 [Echinococcus granulosus]
MKERLATNETFGKKGRGNDVNHLFFENTATAAVLQFLNECCCQLLSIESQIKCSQPNAVCIKKKCLILIGTIVILLPCVQYYLLKTGFLR